MSKRRAYVRHSKRVTRGPRWHTLRMAVLERDGFCCVKCGAKGVRLEVDHIKSVRTHPQGSYDPRNLQTLCSSCHARKTAQELGRGKMDPRADKWRQAVVALLQEQKVNTHASI